MQAMLWPCKAPNRTKPRRGDEPTNWMLWAVVDALTPRLSCAIIQVLLISVLVRSPRGRFCQKLGLDLGRSK